MTNSITKQLPVNDYHDYAIVVLRYYHILLRYACIIVPTKAEAEEIIVQTMLNMWIDRKQLRTNKAVRNYLKTKTKSQCMSWLYSKTLHRKKQTS